MSTISEIDIRDWDKIDIESVRKEIVNIKDHYNGYGGNFTYLSSFINQVEQLRDKQIKEATKNVAALFKPKEV